MASKTMTYIPQGVCSKEMRITVGGGIIEQVQIAGGCAGNTTGVARLIEGLTTVQAIAKLKGIDCKGRGTSCPDQLALALAQFEEQ